MKCSVYIATSVDGYIATPNGGVDWLHTAGNLEADMGDEDMGFSDFMNSVDCMIMGRRCMEMISNMNLTPEQWLYGDMPIFVLSNTVKEVFRSLEVFAKTPTAVSSADIAGTFEGVQNSVSAKLQIDVSV